MKKTLFVITIFFAAVLVGIAIRYDFFGTKKSVPSINKVNFDCSGGKPTPCPDGSYVMPSGEGCMAINCPEVKRPEINLLTFTDEVQGITFQYPEKLNKNYTFAQSWPPKITVSDESYFCEQTQGIKPFAPYTVEWGSGNRDKKYCATRTMEGAAGSIYYTYTFKTEKDDKLITADIVLQQPNCENYSDPQKGQCLYERDHYLGVPGAEFGISEIMDTVTFK